MDVTKLFAKNTDKRIEDLDTNNKNIKPGYRNGIWHRKISHDHDEQKKNNVRKKYAKPKNQNVWKGEKFLLLTNIGSE